MSGGFVRGVLLVVLLLGNQASQAAQASAQSGATTKERSAEAVNEADNIQRLVFNGQDQAALQTLDAGRVPAGWTATMAKYVRGRLYERLNQVCDAEQVFAELFASVSSDAGAATLPSEVSQDIEVRHRTLRRQCGDCGRLFRGLNVPKSTPVDEPFAWIDASQASDFEQWKVAECYSANGRDEEAFALTRRLLRDTTTRVDPVDLRYAAALLARRLSRSPSVVLDMSADVLEASARSWLAEAWVLSGSKPASSVTKAIEQEFEPPWSFPVDEQLDRIERMHVAGHHHSAIKSLRTLGEPSEAEARVRWLHLLGMALYSTRSDYEEAAKVLGVAGLLESPTSVDDAFHAARALARADRNELSAEAFVDFANRHPTNDRRFEARYLAGWLLISARKTKRGLALMREVASDMHPQNAEWRGEAAWELGITEWKRGKLGAARKWLERSINESTDAMDLARAWYWFGRSHPAGAEAEAAFRKSAAVQPWSWYALQSNQQLRLLGVKPEPAFANEDGSVASAGHNASNTTSALEKSSSVKLPDAAAWFATLGFTDDAAGVIQAFEGTVTDQQRVELFHTVGAYAAARRHALRQHVLVKASPADEPWWWDAMYPTPWLDVVNTAIEQAGSVEHLDPQLVYAIMHQESGYNLRAVSPVGARGLMQLMPHVGRAHAKQLGITWSTDTMYEPTVNIRLGVEELSERLQEFDGQAVLTVASYNAGAAPVKEWEKKYGLGDIAYFVDRIPYRETRNYVRRVFTHWIRYRHIDSSEAGTNHQLILKRPNSNG